ncbi:hypothetical protein PWP89_09695 [Stenotrophomonas rhizophila]|uniref:hypothetical protein n=1 Tax=Stenotrophomonas rhizophila TaxID=216778 RepID=UPI000B82DDCC|nr:hypothetical protein [Stenotrophomonas rhizophila]
MFRKIADAMARRQADTEVEHGLRVVRRDWLAFRSGRPKPAEDSVVQYVGPFIVPMMERLGDDSVWGKMEPPQMLDLIFTVLRADAESDLDLAKLEVLRQALRQGFSDGQA